MHVVLYQPEIPQNTGNIGRTCVALGAELWLVRPLGFRLDEQRLRRAGLDYWDALIWHDVADWEQLVGEIPVSEDDFRFFSKRGVQIYDEIQYPQPCVLVFGSETQGLPEKMLSDESRSVRIPIREPVRSLNLSNAVAIAAYQARPR